MTYPIDPELAPILEFLPAVEMDNPPQARANLGEMMAALNAEADTSGVVIENFSIDGMDADPDVPVRLYKPEQPQAQSAALLHIHGGGFVVGDLDSEMSLCLDLCRQLNIVVLSVDYRLAPETPFPGGLHDCYAALSWLHQQAESLQIDPERIGIFGQSAGGGLTAATVLMARDNNGPAICFQYLGIPELDDRLETPSMQAFVDTPLWNKPLAEVSWDYYLGDSYQRGAANVPYLAAPARLEDASKLPPTYVSTMEFDPLRDEGIAYAMKLMQAGVSTELHCYPGTFHGSTMVAHAQISQREVADMMAVVRRGLGLEAAQ